MPAAPTTAAPAAAAAAAASIPIAGGGQSLAPGASPIGWRRGDVCYKWERLRSTARAVQPLALDMQSRANIHTWTWADTTSAANSSTANSNANANKVESEFVFAWGGCAPAHGATRSLEHCSPALARFHPYTQTWAPVDLVDAAVPELPAANFRAEAAAGAFHAESNTYYLFGGKRVPSAADIAASEHAQAALSNVLSAIVPAPSAASSARYAVKPVPTRGAVPPALSGARLAPAGSHALVLFGGFAVDGGLNDDIYVLPLRGPAAFEWRKLPRPVPAPVSGVDIDSMAVVTPAGRVGHVFTTLPALPADRADAADADAADRTHRFLLHGGSDGVATLFDAWELLLTGDVAGHLGPAKPAGDSAAPLATWRRLTLGTAPGATAPAARAHHSIAFTSFAEFGPFRALVFGGCDAARDACFDDVALLDTINWRWEVLPASLAASAYPPSTNSAAASAATVIGDEASLRGAGALAAAAVRAAQRRSPSARRGVAMVPTHGGEKVLFLGGCALADCAGPAEGAGAVFSLDLDALCPASCVAGNGVFVEEAQVAARLQGAPARRVALTVGHGGAGASGAAATTQVFVDMAEEEAVGAHCACGAMAHGKFCQQLLDCPAGCSGHGDCVGPAGKKFCQCREGFWGADCATPQCRRNCSGRGVCRAGPNPLYATLTPFSFASMLMGSETGLVVLAPGVNTSAVTGNAVGNGTLAGANGTAANGTAGANGTAAVAASGSGTTPAALQVLLGLSDQAKARAKEIWFKSQSHCECSQGFFGKECALTKDAALETVGVTCPNGCSGHGLCDPVAGTCQCQAGFSGLACNIECPSDCSGHGVCSHDGVCKCEPGFVGPDCSVRECLVDCSGNGECDDISGQCKCTPGWGGVFCQLRTACSGHGKFVNGKCVCDAGYGNAECSQQVTCAGGCSDRGTCVAVEPLKQESRLLAKPVADAASLALLEEDPSAALVEVPDGTGEDGRVLTKLQPLAAVVDPSVPIAGQCQCARGWRGAQCAQRACAHKCRHGECDDLGQCKCWPGHTGVDCSIPVPCPNNCTSSTSANAAGAKLAPHGVCQVSGVCLCNKGWSGTDCATADCPNGCSGKGSCADGHCYCDKGFSGLDCSVACPKGCSGHGECVTGGKCACFPGYEGADCTLLSQCPRSLTGGECSGRGFCDRARKTCLCEPGFTGADCSKTEGECDADTCGHHGTCRNGQCFCDLGYSGKRCEVANQCVDACNARGFCQHGRCHCYPGYEGDSCETPVADTTCPSGCNKNGFCMHGRCFCQEGFTGPDCATPAGFCANNTCSGNGVCRHGKCHCQPGASGVRCELGGCRKCEAGRGICILGQCHCLPGFTGPDCAQELTCPNSCFGKGVCILGACACLPGYSGHDCSSATGAQPAPTPTAVTTGPALTCPNGCNGKGVCRDGKCYCVGGFEGLDCGIEREAACPMNCGGTPPLYNQRGTCRYGKCWCKPGFEGVACEQELFCSDKCTQNGVCHYGECHCLPGFTGKDCDVVQMINSTISAWAAPAVAAGAAIAVSDATASAVAKTTASPVSTFLDTSTTVRPALTPAAVFALLATSTTNTSTTTAPAPATASAAHANANANATASNATSSNGAVLTSPSASPTASTANVTSSPLTAELAVKPLFNNTEVASLVAALNASAYSPTHDSEQPIGYSATGFALPETLSALVKPCGGESHGCGQHGLCVETAGQMQCVCEPGYTGPDCSLVTGGQLWHRCPQACNKRGLCLLGRCYCDLGFQGPSCEEKIDIPCPNNCSGYGQCSFGKCFCQPGFAGPACDKIIPCSKLCGAHGICFKSQCVCAKGYAGEFCQLPSVRLGAGPSLPAAPIGDAFNDTSLFHHFLETGARAATDDEGLAVLVEADADADADGTAAAHADADADAETAALSLLETASTAAAVQAAASLARLPVSITVAPDEASSAACTDSCGAHGRCIAGRCFCEAGFAGAACSVRVDETSAPALLLHNAYNTAQLSSTGADATVGLGASVAALAERWRRRVSGALGATATLVPLGADWTLSPLTLAAAALAAGALVNYLMQRLAESKTARLEAAARDTHMMPLLRPATSSAAAAAAAAAAVAEGK